MIGFEAGGEGSVELLEGEAADFVEGEEEREGIEAGAVFFARQVSGGGAGQSFEGVAEGAVTVAVEFVAAAEFLDEQEGAHARDDGAEEDADGVLTLVKEGVEQVQSAGQIARTEGVAEVPQDAGAALGNEVADGGETGAATLAEIDVDLFQFVLELAGVVAGHLHEEFEGTAFEGEAELAHFFFRLGEDGLLPTGLGGVGSIVNFDLGELGELFPGGAAFVDGAGAEDKFDVGTEAGLEDGEDVFEALDAGVGASGDAVAEEAGALQPDDLATAKKRQGLQRLDDVGADATGVVSVVGVAFDDVIAEVAGVGWGELADELKRRLLDAGLVTADEGKDVAGGGGFFGGRHCGAEGAAESRPRHHCNWRQTPSSVLRAKRWL